MTLLGELSLLIHQPNFLSIMPNKCFRQKQCQTMHIKGEVGQAAGRRKMTISKQQHINNSQVYP